MCPVTFPAREVSPVLSLPVKADEHWGTWLWGHVSPLFVVVGPPRCGGEVLGVGCRSSFSTS